MTINTSTGHLQAPGLEHPYWRDAEGARITYQDLVSRLDAAEAELVADQHASAVCALARAAAHAQLQGQTPRARVAAMAASQLCGEIVGLWPKES